MDRKGAAKAESGAKLSASENQPKSPKNWTLDSKSAALKKTIRIGRHK